ncbi:MAG TPA: hypothetical protein VG273_16450 [Bryobacteraceae bacterium]|jgi:hypothetical protein|nr:hypothetical protein [Bryobacteraceae bacterium]
MNWPEVSAILTGTFGVVAGAVFVVRLIVREEIHSLRKSFTSRELADERHEDHDRRIELLEGKMLR